VLPEQGQGLVTPVRSRANSRRHGVASSSAWTWRPWYQALSVGCGYLPAPVATAEGMAVPACLVVATAHAIS
jgi:hypothetical protein